MKFNIYNDNSEYEVFRGKLSYYFNFVFKYFKVCYWFYEKVLICIFSLSLKENLYFKVYFFYEYIYFEL